jgi:hypothetical protein
VTIQQTYPSINGFPMDVQHPMNSDHCCREGTGSAQRSCWPNTTATSTARCRFPRSLYTAGQQAAHPHQQQATPMSVSLDVKTARVGVRHHSALPSCPWSASQYPC